MSIGMLDRRLVNPALPNAASLPTNSLDDFRVKTILPDESLINLIDLAAEQKLRNDSISLDLA